MNSLEIAFINVFSPYKVWNRGDILYFETDNVTGGCHCHRGTDPLCHLVSIKVDYALHNTENEEDAKEFIPDIF